MAYLLCTDPGKRAAMEGLVLASREMKEREANNLAVLIANKVGEMLGGGR